MRAALALAMAAAVAAAAALAAQPALAQGAQAVTVGTDESSYEEGDIIVISGTVAVLFEGTPVTIQIFVDGSTLVHMEQVAAAPDGTFSDTVNAEGPKWGKDGAYTVRASYGQVSSDAEFEYTTDDALRVTSSRYEVDAGGRGTFDVDYTVRGADLLWMRVLQEDLTLEVAVSTEDDGSITLGLPRHAIDAKTAAGADDVYIVLVGGVQTPYEQLEQDSESRRIRVGFAHSEEDVVISIMGTYVISGAAAGPAPAPAGRGQASVSLDAVPQVAYAGEEVAFAGRLEGPGGAPLAGMGVEVWDAAGGVPLASAVTGNDGRFAAVWEAAAVRDGGLLRPYAAFAGGPEYAASRSAEQAMTVLKPAALLTLDRVLPTKYVWEPIEFTGKLAAGDGTPLVGRAVRIMAVGPGGEAQLVSTETERLGRFFAWWKVGGGLEGTVEAYAVFDGDATYGRAQSQGQIVSVPKYGGSISLDPVPGPAPAGEAVALSGHLRIEGRNPGGAVVYLKAGDAPGPGDLLAVAYAGADGRFSVPWRAERMGPDNAVSVYAAFEGNDRFEGLESARQELEVLDPGPPAPPAGAAAGRHVELLYALDLRGPPVVHVIPSPDSYGEAERGIGLAQEGIRALARELERRHGGDWSTTFEVLRPGLWSRDAPDVQMLLISPADDSRCGDEAGRHGAAITRPAAVSVCVLPGMSDGDVRAAAAHAFVHAMGIGHAFGAPGDAMCPDGGGIPGCGGRAGAPAAHSALVLDAVARAYGTDGFAAPNSGVEYGEKFYATADHVLAAQDASAQDPAPQDAPPPPAGQDAGRQDGGQDGTEPPVSAAPGSVPQAAEDLGDGDPAGLPEPAAPSAAPAQQPGGGCLIATAAYGTELAPRVQQLREIRDGAALSGGPGAQVMGALHSAYYVASPAVADLERASPELRSLVRAALAPPVAALSLL